MSDQFSSKASELSDPPRNGYVVTPNDNADLPFTTRCIIVGTEGDVAVIHAGDTASVVLPKLAPGVQHAGCFKRILTTGTEPTRIVAQY